MPLEIEDCAQARPRDGALVIALLNNMPDAALEATEAQFGSLLAAAAGSLPVRLRHAWLPEVPRGPQALERLAHRYFSVEALLADPPDGLIVTGMEPRAASLEEEPYWDRMVQVLGWAQTHTASSIWSCLAAHAATQSLRGVRRQRLPEKCFGVFEHRTCGEHMLLRGVGPALPTPHSRWNELPVEKLQAAGFEILSLSAETGADLFVCPGRSLLVCFQGHPEYDELALLKEYRRDVGRYLRAEAAAWPTLPQGYFRAPGVAALAKYRAGAEKARAPAHLGAFPMAELAAQVCASWRPAGVAIYRNWLTHLSRARSG
ncbi:MAG TPA: homoserine O-succinyltransferase [Steroidobacteraceae bacterium]|jgi:homoserine O-succinyltransferase|nr:homoserine O-succinyltransferase [Steroidobacteraceae bacterium]